MLYIVANDFDEQIRLVKASSPDDAITKVKASIPPEELQEVAERLVQSAKHGRKLWDETVADHERHQQWRKENGMPPAPPLRENPYIDDPESFRNVGLDDYDWWVLQEVDPDREIAILEELYR